MPRSCTHSLTSHCRCCLSLEAWSPGSALGVSSLLEVDEAFSGWSGLVSAVRLGWRADRLAAWASWIMCSIYVSAVAKGSRLPVRRPCRNTSISLRGLAGRPCICQTCTWTFSRAGDLRSTAMPFRFVCRCHLCAWCCAEIVWDDVSCVVFRLRTDRPHLPGPAGVTCASGAHGVGRRLRGGKGGLGLTSRIERPPRFAITRSIVLADDGICLGRLACLGT